MIYDIGAECGLDYSFYLVCGKSNFLIDGTSEEYGKEAISAIEKHIHVSQLEAVFFTGTTPDKTGFLKFLLENNKDIKIYASVTGLRNIREILNHNNFNGCICKHGASVQLSDVELKVFITPNLPNPDTIMVYYCEENALFPGCAFSLSSYDEFLVNALDVIKEYKINVICGTFGGVSKNIFDMPTCSKKNKVLIAYSSLTGNNKKIAYAAARVLEKENIDADVICLDEYIPQIHDYSGLILATHTAQRNMPDSVWNFISGIDVSRAKDIPYFVYGSCGWSCEGPYIASENLSMLKLKRVCKVETCIFTPDDEDFKSVEKNTKLLVKILMEKTNA